MLISTLSACVEVQTHLCSDLWIANLTAPLFLSPMLNWQQKASCLNFTAMDFWISLKIKGSLSSLSMWTCVQTLISLWKLLLCCHFLCAVHVCVTYQCHSVNLKWRVFLRGSFTHKCRKLQLNATRWCRFAQVISWHYLQKSWQAPQFPVGNTLMVLENSSPYHTQRRDMQTRNCFWWTWKIICICNQIAKSNSLQMKQLNSNPENRNRVNCREWTE